MSPYLHFQLREVTLEILCSRLACSTTRTTSAYRDIRTISLALRYFDLIRLYLVVER